MAKSPSILIVDDNPGIIESLAGVLGHHGYAVDSAFSGADALSKVRRRYYDMAICDIEMPGISGLDFLENLRRERDLDVILMTGFLDPQYFIRAIRLGAADFISKPIEARQLLKSIEDLLEKKRSRENLSQFISHLDTAHVDLVIDPRKFSLSGIARVFQLFFQQNLKLQQDIYHELLTCVDEMIYNAYIHGTLGLTRQQRQCEHAALQEIIAAKLAQPELAAKRIRFSVSVSLVDDCVCIGVEDDGDGFDYEAWLRKVRQEPQLNLEEHGRGIAMLYHLADELEFSNRGRKVQVRRSLNHRQADQA